MTLGDEFHSSHASQRAKFWVKDRSVEERYALFRGGTTDEIRASAIGNLLGMLVEDAAKSQSADELEHVCNIADRELGQTRGSHLIGSNVYLARTAARDYYLEKWRASEWKDDDLRQKGLRHAQRVRDLKRGEYGGYISAAYPERDDDRYLELFSGFRVESFRENLRRLEKLQGMLKTIDGMKFGK